jgi:hypothetical protein
VSGSLLTTGAAMTDITALRRDFAGQIALPGDTDEGEPGVRRAYPRKSSPG